MPEPSDDATTPGGGLALLALAVAAGANDGATYLGLGRVFTANMTGNTVLLGVAVAQHDGGAALRSAVALGAFAAGVAAGAVVSRWARTSSWPGRAARPLALEVVALAALLAGWLAAGTPTGGVRLALLTASGCAMGVQSAAVLRGGVHGVATTYITGTLTRGVVGAVGVAGGEHAPRELPTRVGLPAAIWVVYAAAGLSGALLERWAGGAAVALPLAVVAIVTVAAHATARRSVVSADR